MRIAMVNYFISIFKFLVFLPNFVNDKLIEKTYCHHNGHNFKIINDVDLTENKNIKWHGVKILKCHHCNKTKMLWY